MGRRSRSQKRHGLAGAEWRSIPSHRLGVQTLLALYVPDVSVAGILITLPLGAWLLGMQGVRGILIALYVVFVGIFLYIYNLGLHISTHGF